MKHVWEPVSFARVVNTDVDAYWGAFPLESMDSAAAKSLSLKHQWTECQESSIKICGQSIGECYRSDDCQQHNLPPDDKSIDSEPITVIVDQERRFCLHSHVARSLINGEGLVLFRNVYEATIVFPTWEEFKTSKLPIGSSLAVLLGHEDLTSLEWKRECSCEIDDEESAVPCVKTEAFKPACTGWGGNLPTSWGGDWPYT